MNEPFKNNPASQQKFPTHLTDTLRQNVDWFNGQYERVFGIDKIRQMQNRVLEAESEFVNITQERKLCQEKIENYKEEIKNIRDKLDITPRQSDNYLKLITEEHKLLREQLSHDAKLRQLKDREQWSLDNMSKLLRQSHELELLRQERAKYWQIISLGLSVAGGIVALFAQKVRNQNTTLRELDLMKQSIQAIKEANELSFGELASQLNVIRSLTSYIADGLHVQQNTVMNSSSKSLYGQQTPVSGQSWTSWLSWVSGYGYIKSKFKG